MNTARTILDDPKRSMRVRCVDNYLTEEEANTLFQEIDKNDVLRSETVTMFGKQHTVKRRSAAYASNEALTYRYSGKTMTAHRAPPSILQLMHRLARDTQEEYNFVLVQAYDDGDISIGWHADDERDIAPNSTIASVSLGTTRDFQLRETTKNAQTITVPLRNGTLLTMEGQTQKHTKHCVPKRARQRGRRINLTFRRIVPQK